MAYAVWRVILKKYTRVRLGLRSGALLPSHPVTPSEKIPVEKSEETLAWSETPTGGAEEDEDRPSGGGDFNRGKGLTKSQRVKSYLQKKCRSRSKSGGRSCSSWYLSTEDSRTEGGTSLEPSSAPPALEDLPPAASRLPQEPPSSKVKADLVSPSVEDSVQKSNLEEDNSDTASEGTLLDETQQDELPPLPLTSVDVAGLVSRYFGPLYPPEVRGQLVREARDLLVTAYLGDLVRFENDFCIPAALEARRLKEEAEKKRCGGWPADWPHTVHGRLSLHLGGPGPGCLLPGDGYLALSPGLTLHTRSSRLLTAPLQSALLPSPADLLIMAAELSASLRSLVVSAERSLARFPLADLAYPCSACGRSPEACVCHPIERRDSAIQTSPMYEMDSSIPHIDSDDEHSDNSFKNKDFRGFVPADRLAEFSETVAHSGIYLPGLHDREGRALLVVEGDRLSLDPTEAARYLHYLATLPHRLERRQGGLRVLTTLKGTNLDILDSTLYLVSQQERVSFSSVIVYSEDEVERSGKLIRSKIEFVTASNKESLLRHISEDQLPASFGGDAVHDQEVWTDFFKSAESLGERCREAGRRLVSALGGLGGGEPTRQTAVLEAKSLGRAVSDPELARLRESAPHEVQTLAARALRLPASEDVRFVLERVEMLFHEVNGTALKLEEMVEKRREKLKDIARIRCLEEETEQVLSWLSEKGDDWLRRNKELATSLPAIRQQEHDFEKFYFISMKQLDKGTDLLEEAVQCSSPGSSGLRDLARSLKNHLRGFSDRLEDTRERLEDTSRCFYLLDRAYEWALEAMKHMSPAPLKGTAETEGGSTGSDLSLKQLEQYLMAHPQPSQDHFTEMISLATKLDNEKLLNQCKLAQCRCEDTADQIRQLLGPEPRWPTRRSSPTCQGGEVAGEEEWTGEKTWHYHPAASDDEEDKLTSSADNTTDGSESGGAKGCDELDESDACCAGSKSLNAPIPVNSHLHSDLSVQLDTGGQCGTQTLKTKKTMLLIMKEMIQTERDYVRSLEYVIENYIPELLRDDIPQAMRGQRNVIFGNIEKIFEFHKHYFLQELEKCEQNPLHVGQCFLRYESKFYLYALYNKNKPKSDALMAEYGTAFFKGKQVELGDKMDLASYLLKPVQRMGKYALLLQQLMKASRTDAQQLKEAETMVRFQLRHGNDLLAMDSLRDCDVNVKEQGRLLRQNEFLVWQGKGSKKYYRHVFLFEELILFSKARRFPDHKNLDLYIYKQSIKTSDIGLTAKVGDSPTKFEIWFRKRKPNDTFTLQAISEEIKQAWTEELSNILWKQAMRNREMRMAEMSSMGIGNKPCLDIRPSANQICDRSISIQQLSKTAPRFRNSIAISPTEVVRKRPHSIISVTSSSGTGSTTSSNGSSSADPLHRESSHCSQSSAESGIVSDWNSSITSSDSSSPQHISSLSVKL